MHNFPKYIIWCLIKTQKKQIITQRIFQGGSPWATLIHNSMVCLGGSLLCPAALPFHLLKRFSSMIFLWYYYWISMGFLWEFHDISGGFLWDFWRDAMGILWYSYGISIGFLWDFYAIPMMFLWYFYGVSIGFLWDFQGISMMSLWHFYGITMGIRMGFLCGS